MQRPGFNRDIVECKEHHFLFHVVAINRFNRDIVECKGGRKASVSRNANGK